MALSEQWSMVNGQPCMPDWAACFRHRGTYVKLLPIYISTCRSLKTEEALNTTNPDPWPPSPMKVNFWSGRNFQVCCPKNVSGVQPVCAHKGSNAKPVWATGGLVAMQNNGPNSNGVVSTFQTKVCISTVPWIFECVYSSLWMRPFHWCRISCHAGVQSMFRGGPTTDRRKRRCKTSKSKRCKSFL